MSENTKTYDIVHITGRVIERVTAKDERQALCVYLANHEELDDMMLWKSAYDGGWKLAPYESDDDCLYARFYSAKVEEIIGLMDSLNKFCFQGTRTDDDCGGCCFEGETPCPLAEFHNKLAECLRKCGEVRK